jgi:DNA-binding CsgD family transcriptional regulator
MRDRRDACSSRGRPRTVSPGISVHDHARRGELGELLERSAELAAIRAGAEAAVAGQGRLVVVEGAAGIGKTALIAATRELARDAGLEPLVARGAELEQAFGFGVVRQLLEPAVHRNGTAVSAFTGAARHAAPLLDVELSETPVLPPGPEAAFAVLHGLYRLTVNLAREQPRALVVDDAHWADGASLRFLAYLAPRLASVRVLLVVAARPFGEPGGVAVASLLGDAAALRPGPLSPEAATRLVRDAVPDAADALCDACHAVTGGNPFFLRELGVALGEAGAVRAADVLDAAPDGVVASVRARLARFPAPARELAAALSILGDGTLLRHATAMTGLDERAAGQAADALRAGRILDGGRQLSFLHPIIRRAVHEELPPAERSSGHGRAARLLAAEDGAPERVAAHLLLAEPAGSEWACERLRAAAREALARGIPDAAVTYLRRALEEPPSEDDRPRLLLELGLAEALTLDLEPAIGHLRRGVQTTRDTVARLYAARMLSSLVGIEHPADGVEILERALAASPDADPALALHIEAFLVNMARFTLPTRRRTMERAARLLERVEAGELDGGVELTVAAMEVTTAGLDRDRAADLARRAIERLRSEPQLAITLGMALRCLAEADHLDEADRLVTATLDEARRLHATYRMAPLLVVRSEMRRRAGALVAAEADAREGLTIYRVARMGAIAGTAVLVDALVEQGKLDAAQAALAGSGTDVVDELGDSYFASVLLSGRARLHLARDDPRAALDDLLECGRREDAAGERNPAVIDWRSQAALALTRLGRRDEALALAAEEVELARRFGAARAIGVALRVHGVVEGGGPGLATLRDAVDTLAGAPARLEHARALTDLGMALRRARRVVEAREPLRQALDLAHRCGAAPLAQLAGTELRIAGGRPRRAQLAGVDALTTNERRVATMAADGRSNPEIAQALFVSRKTVEKHLSAAYRKLGIATRDELAGALAKE